MTAETLLSEAARSTILSGQAYRLTSGDQIIDQHTLSNPGGEQLRIARCHGTPTVKVSADGDAYLWAAALWVAQQCSTTPHQVDALTDDDMMRALEIPATHISTAVLATAAIAWFSAQDKA